MVPTQFIPEYYRDAKDILWAQDREEYEPKERCPRQSPVAYIRRLFGYLAHKPEEKEEEPTPLVEHLAH